MVARSDVCAWLLFARRRETTIRDKSQSRHGQMVKIAPMFDGVRAMRYFSFARAYCVSFDARFVCFDDVRAVRCGVKESEILEIHFAVITRMIVFGCIVFYNRNAVFVCLPVWLRESSTAH